MLSCRRAAKSTAIDGRGGHGRTHECIEMHKTIEVSPLAGQEDFRGDQLLDNCWMCERQHLIVRTRFNDSDTRRKNFDNQRVE